MAEADKNVYYDTTGIPRAAEGEIRISNEVIANIATHACREVDGFHGFTEGFVDGLSKMLQGELTEGIVVRNVPVEGRVEEFAVEIELSVILLFGHTVQSVAEKLQKAVKDKVEEATGVDVAKVHINVQGIHFQK